VYTVQLEYTSVVSQCICCSNQVMCSLLWSQ